MNEQRDRLDSWKEIAGYLGRDERTAMRWAKGQGLPVRRVAGGRGRSVFAFAHEIDAWLAGQPDAGLAASVDTGGSASARPSRTIAATVALLVPVAVGVVLWFGRPAATALDPRQVVEASATGLSLTSATGVKRQLFRFDPGVSTVLPQRPAPRVMDVDADGVSEVLFGISYFEDESARIIRTGELLNLTPAGTVRWRFAFDDHVQFASERFAGPWALTDWQVGPAASPSRIAVAAHHSVWWASMTAVLDHTGRRLGTFINPGWLESLLWLDHDRVAIGGFSNERDAGVLAVIDANQAASQAPGTAGSPFACVSCAGGSPLFYAALPRSELNVITGSRFNRAELSWLDDRLLVTTTEVPGDPLAATALYEFDRDLRLVRARYDGVYWDAHRRLELEGRITHTREQCPEKDGPPVVHVWQNDGWMPLSPRR